MKKFFSKVTNFFAFWRRPTYNWINVILARREITKRQSIWINVLAKCGRPVQTSFCDENFVTVFLNKKDLLKILPPHKLRTMKNVESEVTISIDPKTYGATGDSYLPDGPATIRLQEAVKRWKKMVKADVTLHRAPARGEALK